MKVKDLIDKLKPLPADIPVLVQGYEDGFDDIKDVRLTLVLKNPEAQDYNGKYEEVEKGKKDAVPVVAILGNRR